MEVGNIPYFLYQFLNFNILHVILHLITCNYITCNTTVLKLNTYILFMLLYKIACTI